MNKRAYKYFALPLAFVCGCLVACDKETVVIKSDKTLVYERIETFEKAYNDGDWENLMGSFSAKTRNQIEAIFNVMGGFVGGLTGFSFNLSDFFTLGIGIMGEGDILTVEIESVSISGTTAIAIGEMGYRNPVGTTLDDVYFELVKENGGWYIVDMQDDTPPLIPDTGADGTTSEEGVTDSRYPITTTGDFTDGRAWVKYKKADDYYWGFIDTTGKAVYSQKADGCEVFNIGKGSGLVKTNDECKLIDKNGEVRLTVEGKSTIKYGGGYVWVYQDKSTITSLAHMYGMFDYNGTWLMPMENLEKTGLLDTFTYVGDGMIGEASYRDTTDYTITNFNPLKQRKRENEDTVIEFMSTNIGSQKSQDIIICIENARENWNIEFENGMAYVEDKLYSSNGCIAVTTYDENGESTTVRQEIDGNFILYTDGRAVQLEETPKWYTDGRTVTEKEGYYEITDYRSSTPKTFTLTKYPSSMVEKITFSGNYALVELYGVDKKHYFTLFDTNGNEMYEPIYREGYGYYSYYMELYPDGNVIWWRQGEESSYYERVDKTGNVLVLGTSGALVGGDGWTMPDTSQGYLLKADSSLHYSYYSFNKELLFSGVKEK